MAKRLFFLILILSGMLLSISAKKLTVVNTSAWGMEAAIKTALAGDDRATIDTLLVTGTDLLIADCRHLRDSFLTNLVHLDLSGASFLNDSLPVSVNDGSGTHSKGGAFQSMVSLKSVILPEGLRVIGDRAFRECALLEEIVLPNSLEKIMSRVFLNCKKLALTNLPDGINHLGDYAFGNCEELVLEKLPNELTDMSSTYVFQNCRKLALTSLPVGVTGVVGKQYFDGCYLMGVSQIPDGITQINQYAFRNNWEMTSITFSENLDTLGTGVFAADAKYCKLTEICFKGHTSPKTDPENSPFRVPEEVSVYIPAGSLSSYFITPWNTMKKMVEYQAVFTGVGNWSDVENWSTGILPAANDTVLIDGDITIDDDQSIAGLIVKDGSSVTVANEKYLNVTHILTGNSQDVVTLNGSAQLFRPEDEFTGLEKLSNKNRKTNVSVTSERQIIVDVREVLDDSFSNKVSVFNIFGQLIHQENINTPRIFLNTWFDTGVYFVQIGKQNTHKVIIQ